jgi:hypothetical protein
LNPGSTLAVEIGQLEKRFKIGRDLSSAPKFVWRFRTLAELGSKSGADGSV